MNFAALRSGAHCHSTAKYHALPWRATVAGHHPPDALTPPPSALAGNRNYSYLYVENSDHWLSIVHWHCDGSLSSCEV